MNRKFLSLPHDVPNDIDGYDAMMLDADCDTYTGSAQAQHSLYTSHILLPYIITAYFTYNLQYQ